MIIKKKRMSVVLTVVLLLTMMFSVSASAESVYTVKQGDVLWKIARQYGLEWESLATYNQLKNPHRIYVNQKIRIPDLTPPKVEPEIQKTTLTILHTNDMHGFFVEGAFDGMGAAKMATYFKSVKAEANNVLLLDAGDATQGANLVTLSKGDTAIDVLNALGYDAMTLGNHEFDYGIAALKANEEKANFPFLAANIKDEDGKNFATPYVIKTIDGIKVAILGLATPETLYKSHPDNTVGYTFENPVDVARLLVPELKKQADVVIALVHLGDEGDYSSWDLANKVAGIDLIIDGHSHSTYETGENINGTLVVSAGEKTKNVGRVEIKLEDKKIMDITASLFTKEASLELADDEAMVSLIASITEKNSVIENEIVAESPIHLEGDRAVVRTGESTMGNMITEALLHVSGADIALTNGGGIRASIEAGEVTKGDVLTVLPYGNTVRVIELTGADIITAIENGIKMYPEQNGGFPHVAGMTITFDSSQEAGSRVVSIMIGEDALELDKTYTLATNDFLVAGGDGYSVFKGKKVVGEYGTMDEVLIDYMNAQGFDAAEISGKYIDINVVEEVDETAVIYLNVSIKKAA